MRHTNLIEERQSKWKECGEVVTESWRELLFTTACSGTRWILMNRYGKMAHSYYFSWFKDNCFCFIVCMRNLPHTRWLWKKSSKAFKRLTSDTLSHLKTTCQQVIEFLVKDLAKTRDLAGSQGLRLDSFWDYIPSGTWWKFTRAIYEQKTKRWSRHRSIFWPQLPLCEQWFAQNQKIRKHGRMVLARAQLLAVDNVHVI